MSNNTFPEPMVTISLKEYNSLKDKKETVYSDDKDIMISFYENAFGHLINNIGISSRVNFYYEIANGIGYRLDFIPDRTDRPSMPNFSSLKAVLIKLKKD